MCLRLEWVQCYLLFVIIKVKSVRHFKDLNKLYTLIAGFNILIWNREDTLTSVNGKQTTVTEEDGGGRAGGSRSQRSSQQRPNRDRRAAADEAKLKKKLSATETKSKTKSKTESKMSKAKKK